MEDFGQYLKSLRLEQRLSPRAVEKQADVSSSYLAQVELRYNGLSLYY